MKRIQTEKVNFFLRFGKRVDIDTPELWFQSTREGTFPHTLVHVRKHRGSLLFLLPPTLSSKLCTDWKGNKHFPFPHKAIEFTFSLKMVSHSKSAQASLRQNVIILPQRILRRYRISTSTFRPVVRPKQWSLRTTTRIRSPSGLNGMKTAPISGFRQMLLHSNSLSRAKMASGQGWPQDAVKIEGFLRLNGTGDEATKQTTCSLSIGPMAATIPLSSGTFETLTRAGSSHTKYKWRKFVSLQMSVFCPSQTCLLLRRVREYS